MSAISSLHIVKDRMDSLVQRRPGISKAVAAYISACELWDDEFRAYSALCSRGLYDAAECAWQRRTNAVQLSDILLTAVS